MTTIKGAMSSLAIKSQFGNIFMGTLCSRRFHLVLPFLMTILLCSLSSQTWAEESTPADKAPRELVSAEDFEYIVGDRKDPFVPFITAKATTANIDMNEIVDVDKELTGMQLFEPGQLTLVALMSGGGHEYAMVQDFTGKGYVISEGTKIGKRGVVMDITSNKVIIEETAQTRAGQKIVTNTVMVLKKEGEE